MPAHRLCSPPSCLKRIVLLGAIAVSAANAADRAGLTAKPLSPRLDTRNATLFTELSPDQTGIRTENRFADPKMWTDRYNEFVFGEIGTGVAVGDFDNDGRPDLFLVSKTEPARLFRNLGDWKFEDVSEKAGLLAPNGSWEKGVSLIKSWMGKAGTFEDTPEAWKQGAAFADVNNDGWLDLYVCRLGAPNLLFINQRDGTFKEEAAARGLAVVDGSGMAAFCDYDRDGWLDVYIHTNMLDSARHPNGQRDYLFHNNGDGTFADVTGKAGIQGETAAHSATWWDFNNDGWPDIYVANDYAPADRLYRNNGDGTFTDVVDQVVPHTPYYGMGSDLGDVNNDGLIDLFVTDMAATTHEKDFRGMANSRSLNKETSDAGPAVPEYLRNALYLNTGRGVFQEAAFLAGLAATDWTWSPRLEDLDCDGRLDLFVTNGMNREYHNRDLLDRLMGVESLNEPRRLMRESPPLAEANLAFRNLGDLAFENVSKAWGLDHVGVSFGSAFADFDGDGDLDLVYSNYEHGVSVLRNNGTGGHRLVVELRGTASNRFGVGGTVQLETKAGVQIRQLVLARGYLSTSEPIFHFGLGDVSEIERVTVSWPSGEVQRFEHVAVDQRLTITEPAGGKSPPRFAAQSLPTGQFTRLPESAGISVVSPIGTAEEPVSQPLLTLRQNRRGPGAAIADINGDGRIDILVAGAGKAAPHILLGQSETTFVANTAPLLPQSGSPVNDGPVLVFDADGDGRDDLLLAKTGGVISPDPAAYSLRLFLNRGGRFESAAAGTLPQLAISVGALAAADYDRDGALDLFVGGRNLPGKYPLPPRSALLRNRRGGFEDITGQLAPGLKQVGMVTSALWSDVDGDGWVDLLVTLEWGHVRCFHNEQGSGFSDWTEKLGFTTAGKGWWTSISAADFNSDGRIDYAVGNVGLNTQYRADPAHPALLLVGDFGTGPQLVEAFYEGDRLYPWRTRKDLGAKIPSALKKFPKTDAFARATLDEILGREKLAAAQRFEATELRSGVFLSQADGAYRFAPLPRIAQIAPVQGSVSGDFDGDGVADLYVVQNSYSPLPVVGHFDGGISQLLKGDGKGGFVPVPATESGLVVPGDAKALLTGDLNGDAWPDFFVTRNNEASLAFANQPINGRQFLAVVLEGRSGNRPASGAQVSLLRSDGSTTVAESYLGSGYMSQSSNELFFGSTEQNAPQTLRVRWPDGSASEQDVRGQRGRVVVREK
jgi:enediyne biosynthesis protein E4